MQRIDDFEVLSFDLLRSETVGIVWFASFEPLVEQFGRFEEVGQEEVEQGPKFVKIILQGRSGDEQFEVGGELAYVLGEAGELVLETVGLVHDDVHPVELPELVDADVDRFVARHANVELSLEAQLEPTFISWVAKTSSLNSLRA